MLDRNTQNHLTVCKKMSSGSFKNLINKMCLQIIYMYKEDLELNNQHWLICHKSKPNLIYLIYTYEKDLALNNLHLLICQKTKPNLIYLIYMYEKDLALNNLQ